MILVLVLVAIAFHDLRTMKIPLPLLVFVLLTGFIRVFMINKQQTILPFGFMNLLVTVLIFLLAVLVLFIRKGKIFNPINHLIGSGDLLFLPLVCFSFSPLYYLAFITGSSLLVLILNPILRRENTALPLAGAQAMLLTLCIVIAEIFGFNLFNDQALINLIM
jgi:Flp pilus assembly protein protease CpaA